MSEPVLIILAAGMGSRYSKQSGLKQVDSVGPGGEKIIDYSLYDALRAGFRRTVFVIKREHLSLFENQVFPKVDKRMKLDYVFQELDDLPEGYTVPEQRVKPWGTGHAALVAARTLGDAPYAVINADDFYGYEAYKKLYAFLSNVQESEKLHFAMVGYYLKNTVTENGSVSRGICESENGMLTSVTERTNIKYTENGIAFSEDDGATWNSLSGNEIVSMNFWGFTKGFTEKLEAAFKNMLENDVPQNPLKSELFLPFVVNDLILSGEAEVTLLSSGDKWYGVTHHEDKQNVSDGLARLTEHGIYPTPIWGE